MTVESLTQTRAVGTASAANLAYILSANFSGSTLLLMLLQIASGSHDRRRNARTGNW